MKKKVFCVFIICFSSATTFAQLSGGIKGGLNLSSQSWEIETESQSASENFDKPSFHFGGYLNYKFNAAMSIQPELIYNSIKIDVEEIDLSLNYLTMPLLFGYGFGSNTVVLQAGPQLGILLSSKPDGLASSGYFEVIDISADFGAVVNMGRFNLGIRYSMGIFNIADAKFSAAMEDILGESTEIKVKNNNLQFSLGYKLFGK